MNYINNNSLLSFSLLSVGAVFIYAYRRKKEVIFSSLKLFTKAQLFINDLISKFKDETENENNQIKNMLIKN